MTAVFVGSVPGPLSQMTECPFDGVAQLNVTVPAETVSGVGEKRLFLTAMFAVWPPPVVPPPPPYVGELLQPNRVAQTAITMSERFCMTRLPPEVENCDGPEVYRPSE